MTPAYGSRARCGLGSFLTCVARSSSRGGAGVTADEMREMQWVKPELVAQIRFYLPGGTCEPGTKTSGRDRPARSS